VGWRAVLPLTAGNARLFLGRLPEQGEISWLVPSGGAGREGQEDMRVVPLGILLATDDSLKPVVNLEIGTGIWRDPVSNWHPWRAGHT
jgi:hypothetical protein